jgi:hypothetical protein
MYFLALLMLFSVQKALPIELVNCVSATETQNTSWGQQNVVIVHRKPMQIAYGIVTGGRLEGPPLEGVLVEVYDHPEVVLREGLVDRRDRTGQQQIAACVTDKTGRFGFKLPPGKYELRLSKPIEWNCTSVLVEVRTKAASNKPLRVALRLAE